VPKKDEIYWKILDSAVALDVRQGHQKWTMTQLSRSSGVSRTLIYYYFGRSKLGILDEAISIFGNVLTGLTAEHSALWDAGRIAESFIDTRKTLIERSPSVIPFYFLNRTKENEVGQAIRKKEKAYREKLSTRFPGLTAAQRDGVYALLFGIPFCGPVSEEAIRSAFGLLLSALPKR
jgi:AcrR family transcriptional regulator